MSRWFSALLLALVLLAGCDNPLGARQAATVSLGRPELNVVPGQDFQLPLDVRDGDGRPVTGARVRWATEDSTFVKISATGVIRALRPGRGPVSATVGSVVSVVWVLAYTERLHVWPDTVALAPGSTRALAARARPGGAEPAVLDGIVWESSNPAVARVDSAGQVTAVANGHATITAVAGPTRITSEAYVSTYPRALRFTSVTSGRKHSCGLTAEGEAYCWGSGDYGQLGASQPTDRCETIYHDTHGVNGRDVYRCSAVPVRVDAGARFTLLSAGDSHVCGLTAEGEAYCWGGVFSSNSDSSVPRGNPAPPTRVPGGLVFRSVSAGSPYACGVTTGGAAYCWGPGDGASTWTGAPVAVGGGVSFASVSVGSGHACGMTLEGATYCWGSNVSGQLGAPSTDTCSGVVPNCAKLPVRVSGDVRFRAVEAGPSGTCALDAAGRAYCWGAGGTLGNLTEASSPVPVPVSGNLVFTTLSAFATLWCGIAADGATYCWGRGSMRPDGTVGGADLAPTRAAPSFALRALDVGGSASCGIGTDGITYCWGTSFEGGLGNGTYSSARTLPVRVAGQ